MYHLSSFNGYGLFRHQIVDGEAKNEMYTITDNLLRRGCDAAGVSARRSGRTQFVVFRKTYTDATEAIDMQHTKLVCLCFIFGEMPSAEKRA